MSGMDAAEELARNALQPPKKRGRPRKAVTGMAAGHAREEQKRVNSDALAEEAAKREQHLERGAIPKKVMEPINVILSLSHLASRITKALPDYEYAWVWTGRDGIMVDQKLTEVIEEDGHPQPCWEVVQGDMPEAPERKRADGTTVRRWGDTILMRCRKDRHAKLVQRQKERAERYKGTPDANLEEMNAQNRGRGVRAIVQSPLADPRLRRLAQRAAQQGFSPEQFYASVDRQLREGLK